MRESSAIGRGLLGAGIVLAAIVVVVVLVSGGNSYHVNARFPNASQLVKGNLVQVAGVQVGTVKSIDLTDDGEATSTCEITDDTYKPLRRGTIATVRQASLSGVANRYIDLQPARTGASRPTLDDGATIPSARHDERRRPRRALQHASTPRRAAALQGVIKGFATAYDGGHRRGEHRLAVPQPVAGRDEPAVRGAQLRHAAAAALRHRELQARHRPCGAPRRPRRPRHEPLDRRPARWPTRRPRSATRSAACRRSCAARTRRS